MQKKVFSGFALRKKSKLLRNFVTGIFLLTTVLATAANLENETPISLEISESSILKVFNQIEKQSNYNFAYDENQIKNVIVKDLKVETNDISIILKQLEVKTMLSFKIVNQTITVKKVDAEISPKKAILKVDEQDRDVSGTVTDQDGSPLPGASVILKDDPTVGTQTDFDGNFSLTVSSDDAVLVFSFVGYMSQEVAVGGQSTINVSMLEDSESLDEVVLIGYGSQKKEEVTAAISAVDVKEISKIPTSDVASSLQGQVAGVNVSNASGAPGSEPVIRIRGLGTIGNNNPLYVIDGVPGDLSYINPADIESISVLKDASAATIYGSRASNGVIIISTKRGRSGEPKVVLNAYLSSSSFVNNLDIATRDQHNQIKLDAYGNAGITPAPYLTNGVSYADSDWDSEYFKNAFEQKYDIGISGGTDKMSYNFSGGFFDNSGTVINTSTTRFNTRMNLDFKLFNDYLKISPGVGYARTNTKDIFEPIGSGNASFSPFLDLYSQLPHKEIYDSSSSNGFATPPPELGSGNPIGEGMLTDRTNMDDYFQFNIAATVKIIDDLHFTFQYGTNIENTHFSYFLPTYDFGAQATNEDPYLSESRARLTDWTLNNTLNYNKAFGDHHLDVLLGFSRDKSEYRSVSGTNTELSSDQLRALSAGIGDESAGGFNSTSTLQSYFGRINYDFDNRFYFQGSLRQDGSSRFGPDNKYGTFYSVSLGWAMHHEDFLSSSDVLSQLKPRVSYGTLGNQLIGDHLFLSRIGSGGQQLNYPFGESVSQSVSVGAISTELSTPNIKWEETATTNFGVDVGFLDNRISATFDYFVSETTDMLVRVPIPASSGITAYPLTNGGDLSNEGWDFTVAYKNGSDKEFTYDVSVNMSSSKNEVTKLGLANESFTDGFIEFNNFPTTRTEVGGEIGRFYLYQADGLFRSQAEVDAQTLQPNAAPGDIRFKDTNGDTVLDDDDKVFMGSGLPDLEYGIRFNAQYKNFDINMFFHGTSGNKMYNGVKMWFYRSDRNNMSSDLLNAWSPDNAGSNIPRNVFGDPNNNIRPSSYFLEDASYFRLQNLQIGYTLPGKISEKAMLSNARFYVTGTNLFTITDYSGFDPGLANGGTFTRGVDRGFYPISKSFVLGVSLSF